jgi:hypothetical protein
MYIYIYFFEVLLTVHLSTFISVFNQLHAQNLFHNKFYFISLHVSSIRAQHQEVKIVLNSYPVSSQLQGTVSCTHARDVHHTPLI